MDFEQAMEHVLKTDHRTRTDPFLLYAKISDLIGNDYEAKKAAEEFYRLEITKRMTTDRSINSPSTSKRRKRKREPLDSIPQPPNGAIVYYGEDTTVIHLNRDCIDLQNAPLIHRTTCANARRWDAWRLSPNLFWWSPRLTLLTRNHTLNICRRCGGVTKDL